MKWNAFIMALCTMFLDWKKSLYCFVFCLFWCGQYFTHKTYWNLFCLKQTPSASSSPRFIPQTVPEQFLCCLYRTLSCWGTKSEMVNNFILTVRSLNLLDLLMYIAFTFLFQSPLTSKTLVYTGGRDYRVKCLLIMSGDQSHIDSKCCDFRSNLGSGILAKGTRRLQVLQIEP